MPSKPPTRKDPRKKLHLVGKVLELPTRAERSPPRIAPERPLAPLDPERAERALAQMAARTVAPGGLAEAQRAQLTIIHTLAEPKACYLVQYVPGREQLQVVSVRGRNDARIRAVPPGEGPVGLAFSERRIVRESGLIAAPVVGPESVLGCLVLVSPKHGLSDALLETMAAQLAAAWEFARLQDDGARRQKDLQTAVTGLKSLERNREELLSNVSHDLKNPLTTIKAYLAMLTSDKLGALNDKQRKAVQTCDRNADRLLRMVTDLLLISRLQSGKMELNQRPFGVKAVTEEVLQSITPIAEAAKVRLKARRAPEVFVRGDRERISEALYNLLDHAIHESPAQGEVELAVRSDGTGLAQVTVSFQGEGVPAEQLSHLFETYYRPDSPDQRATGGLGLPITAKIVHLHGGRIDVTSKAGERTTFHVALPMFAGAITPIEASEGRRAGGILLVEDDADCREVLQQVLEQEGYRVIAASAAGEAKAVLANIKPGLVLLDLRLRDDDGRSVLRFIRETEALADVPVYLISGSSEVASLGAGRGKDRIEGFFEKPLQLPKLLDTVASVVRPSRRNAAAP
ncbi:MAG TPA: ATP-binding protein [Myxococcaceae bacterium]|nr:ATP-binding protein [Myxococcaceae bacterium]